MNGKDRFTISNITNEVDMVVKRDTGENHREKRWHHGYSLQVPFFALSEVKFEDNCTGRGVVSEQRLVTVLEGFISSLKKLKEHNA